MTAEVVLERVGWIASTRTHLRELGAGDALCQPRRGTWELYRLAKWNSAGDDEPPFEEPDYPICLNCELKAVELAEVLEAELVIRPRLSRFDTEALVSEASSDDGLAWKVIPNPDEVKRRCRLVHGRPADRCPNTAVAELNRWRAGRNGQGRVPSWWAYCGEHLYGRWIEGGRVLHWRLVEVGE